jgi:hypothetical protein
MMVFGGHSAPKHFVFRRCGSFGGSNDGDSSHNGEELGCHQHKQLLLAAPLPIHHHYERHN